MKGGERAKRFELSAVNSEVAESEGNAGSASGGYTQIHAQIAGASGRELSQIVAAWEKLSVPLRVAILAIVQSVEAAK
jgi:hypothetical protein